MPDKIIETRIQVLNDTKTALNASTEAPLKGEVVFETDSNKIKIGDGDTLYKDLAYIGGDEAKNYEVTPNEGETDADALARVITAEVHAGDTAIVKRVIADDKISYTAYVYDGAWKAMDGNYDAENVYFSDNLTYTANIGVKTVPASGSGTINAVGKNIKEVLASILAEEKNPSKTNPAVTIGTQTNFGTFEIGTKKNLGYSATLSAGSYTYGPATGITAQTWEVSCTGVTDKKTTATGTFEGVVAEATAKKITAKATYNEGAVPVTNLGNAYPAGKIAAGSVSTNSKEFKGVRHMFYGPMTTDTALDSAAIRALTHEAAAKKTIATFGAGADAKKVVIACPAGYNVTTVLMPSAMNADATASFVKQAGTVQVEGAEGYTAAAYSVWVYQPASIDSTETYAVTIG